MTKKSEFVFNGWLNLTDSEKKEVLKEIENYIDVSDFSKRLIIEKYKKRADIITGPLGSTCPCCGR